jgi:2'-5' RNA ligase
MQPVRAFIAIELPPDVLAQVTRLQSRVRQDLPPGLVRWVRPEGIHLTLKFLGDIDPARVPEIEQAMRRACAPHAPFTLHAEGLGCFPNPNRPRVVWVGVTPAGRGDPLPSLQRAVERAVAPLGFPTERRGFHPHLTLGRVRNRQKPDELAALGAYVTRAKVRVGQLYVSAVRLMRSELLPSGAVYSALATVPLTAHSDTPDSDG